MESSTSTTGGSDPNVLHTLPCAIIDNYTSTVLGSETDNNSNTDSKGSSSSYWYPCNPNVSIPDGNHLIDKYKDAAAANKKIELYSEPHPTFY